MCVSSSGFVHLSDHRAPLFIIWYDAIRKIVEDLVETSNNVARVIVAMKPSTKDLSAAPNPTIQPAKLLKAGKGGETREKA